MTNKVLLAIVALAIGLALLYGPRNFAVAVLDHLLAALIILFVVTAVIVTVQQVKRRS